MQCLLQDQLPDENCATLGVKGMERISQLWPLLFLIPVMFLGIVFLVFPQKIMRFLAFFGNPLGMDDDSLDNIPTVPGTQKWLFGGRTWSEFLRTMREKPEELRYRMLWIRILGFAFLLMVLLGLCLLSLAIRARALTI